MKVVFKDLLLLLTPDIITAETSMKMESTQAVQGTWDFSASQQLITHADLYDIDVHGHAGLWDGQVPTWLWAALEAGNLCQKI